jgi:hypothetical protein
MVWPASYAGQTGVGSFCGSSQVLSGCSSRDRSDRCCSTVWLVQSSGARVAWSDAFSSRCRWLLVPRTSSTPMATWFWPTWVVESEMCFGSCVYFVGVPISFEKNFYQLQFSPSSLAPDCFFNWYQSRFGSFKALTSLRSKDGIPGIGFGSSTLRSMKRTTRCGRDGWLCSCVGRVRSFGMLWWTQLMFIWLTSSLQDRGIH